jgi:hypothetical protein
VQFLFYTEVVLESLEVVDAYKVEVFPLITSFLSFPAPNLETPAVSFVSAKV